MSTLSSDRYRDLCRLISSEHALRISVVSTLSTWHVIWRFESALYWHYRQKHADSLSCANKNIDKCRELGMARVSETLLLVGSTTSWQNADGRQRGPLLRPRLHLTVLASVLLEIYLPTIVLSIFSKSFFQNTFYLNPFLYTSVELRLWPKLTNAVSSQFLQHLRKLRMEKLT